MRTPWRTAMVVGVALTVAACSSGKSNSSGDTATTAATAPVAPSTVLNPYPAVTVPFTADDGALTVTAGPAPDDVAQDQAASITTDLLGSQPGPPQITSVLHGLVTFGQGLTADAVVARPAWVVVFSQPVIGACVGLSSPPTAPASASNLHAMIILGPPTPISEDGRVIPAPVFDYLGAGLVVCYPATTPTILDLYQMYDGRR